MPFVAAVQTTPDGQPQFVCLRQQPFTHEGVGEFAARCIAPSATVISDRLWCFGAVQLVGADHERVVTGGGKASTSCRSSARVNTFLGNLKCSLGGTYHAFEFASTPIVTSPRPNTDSTVASMCAPSWLACCAPLASLLQRPPSPFAWLR